jgi:hypothetical protein
MSIQHHHKNYAHNYEFLNIKQYKKMLIHDNNKKKNQYLNYTVSLFLFFL